MGKYATGNKSQAISDRSGQAFPYNEMVKEWNGSLVHISEFEPKHPQIQRRYTYCRCYCITKYKTTKISTTTNNEIIKSNFCT